MQAEPNRPNLGRRELLTAAGVLGLSGIAGAQTPVPVRPPQPDVFTRSCVLTREANGKLISGIVVAVD